MDQVTWAIRAARQKYSLKSIRWALITTHATNKEIKPHFPLTAIKDSEHTFVGHIIPGNKAPEQKLTTRLLLFLSKCFHEWFFTMKKFIITSTSLKFCDIKDVMT